MIAVSEVDIEEKIIMPETRFKRGSAEKLVKKLGAEEVYDREITVQEHK